MDGWIGPVGELTQQYLDAESGPGSNHANGAAQGLRNGPREGSENGPRADPDRGRPGVERSGEGRSGLALGLSCVDRKGMGVWREVDPSWLPAGSLVWTEPGESWLERGG